MADDTNANPDANNGNEPTLDDLVKQNSEAKDMESLRKLNEQIFARLKKTEEKLKDPKRNEAQPNNGGHQDPPAPDAKPEDAPIGVLEYNELREAGISHETITTIAKAAKERKMSVAALWADPIYKAGILAQNKAARGRDNTPPPSGRVSEIVSNHEIPGVADAKTPKERLGAVTANSKKIFEERVQGKTGGESGQ